MRYWYDCEFLELGPKHPIYLLSIGIVSEDDRELYLQNSDCPVHLASQWIKENVFPHLQEFEVNNALFPTYRANGNAPVWQRSTTIAEQIRQFMVGDDDIHLYAYYGSYDHVVLCQLFGTMMDLPKGFPMYTRDIKQICDELGNPTLPEQGKNEHQALLDARWTRDAYLFLMERKAHLSTPITIYDRAQFELAGLTPDSTYMGQPILPPPTILSLEAKANAHGLTVYNIHHCRPGWGVTWYDSNKEVGEEFEMVTRDLGDGRTFDTVRGTDNYKKALVTYAYYPTPDEMLRAEMKRLEDLPNAVVDGTSE